MPRPRKMRMIRFDPGTYYFKPKGVPLRNLKEIILFPDEVEALKLYNLDALEQKEAAERMGISQPTFARTLQSANRKLTEAIFEAKAIRIEKK
jgi:predicted DNA-binding protein (UPF0251 family)